MVMVALIETINMVLLMSNYSVINVLMNFLALCVIADFDQMFVSTMFRDRCYQFVDNQGDEEF